MEALLQERRLVYVTGKGGVGKTTVAAALGLAAAEAGRRTIVCEVAEQDRMSRAFQRHGVRPEQEVELAPDLWAITIDPQRALEEWLGKQVGGEDKARDFVTRIYKNVPVLDSGARGSTTTFVERGVGDVFISWENEAFLAQRELGPNKFEIVVPSLSILAEPPVAVVDKNVDRKGTRKVAEAYLEYLYSDEGQEIAARNYYRPTNAKVAGKYAGQFPKVALFTINDAFGGWQKAAKTHFADGGTFDQIYKPGAP